MSYIPEPYISSKNKIKIELDLPNFETKSDLKGVTGIDTLKFSKKTDLASIKSNVDRLDLDELETTHV